MLKVSVLVEDNGCFEVCDAKVSTAILNLFSKEDVVCVKS